MKEKRIYKTQYERMTQEPVSSLIIRLGIPTTISMLVTNIYNMVDTMFVGKLGTSASGAVGIVFGFMAILQAFGFMYGQGAGSIISRKLGEKDEKTASVIASTSFALSFVTGLIIAVCGFIFITPMMYLLGSTDTILPYAKTYVTYILIASPFMTSCFTLNNILRYEGKANLSMVGLLAGALLNIAGDPLLMFVFDMGIAGAGLSTAISQIISFVILLSVFLMGKTDCKMSFRNISTRISDVTNIVATGFPSLVRQGLSSIATMVLNGQAKLYGDAAVAAMSIVNRLSMFIFSAGLGIGQGFQPVSGFNYGAKKYSRVKSAFYFTLGVSEVIIGVVAIAMLTFSNQAIGIFRDDLAVIEFGTTALQYQCLAMFLQPVAVMANMLFQSTGNKGIATVLSMLRSGLYFIPMLLILVHFFGPLGIKLAQPLTDVVVFITSVPFVLRFFAKLMSEEKDTAGGQS